MPDVGVVRFSRCGPKRPKKVTPGYPGFSQPAKTAYQHREWFEHSPVKSNACVGCVWCARCLLTDIVAFRGVERVPPSMDIVPFGARCSEGCLDHGRHGKIGSTPKRDGKAKTGTPPACRIDIKLARGMVA